MEGETSRQYQLPFRHVGSLTNGEEEKTNRILSLTVLRWEAMMLESRLTYIRYVRREKFQKMNRPLNSLILNLKGEVHDCA
jgi:hypothetical protein